MGKINCFRCEYFSLTHKPQNPYACKAFGFRSQQIPSSLVRRETGAGCLAYQPKERAHPKDKKS